MSHRWTTALWPRRYSTANCRKDSTHKVVSASSTRMRLRLTLPCLTQSGSRQDVMARAMSPIDTVSRTMFVSLRTGNNFSRQARSTYSLLHSSVTCVDRPAVPGSDYSPTGIHICCINDSVHHHHHHLSKNS